MIVENYFSSSMANELQAFLNEKLVLGHKLMSFKWSLQDIDKKACEFPTIETFITKQFSDFYAQKRKTEKAVSHYKRILQLNDFSSYLQRLGSFSYISPTPPKPKRSYIPYIFSIEEINKMFAVCKKVYANYKHYALTVELVISILYHCGMRESEVANIRLQDFDAKNSVIIIAKAKFNKQRYVPISKALSDKIILYIYAVHFPGASRETKLLKNGAGQEIQTYNIYNMFRKVLDLAHISHHGKGLGPRVHDFRHTFAVQCLKQLVASGTDISLSMVYLSKYLGHASLESTQYYLRLTSDVYPSIVQSIIGRFGEVVPKMEEQNAET